MANTLEYAKIFTQVLDELVEQRAVTAWTEANASQVRYNGGNEIKVAKIEVDGLDDYNRATGYADGAVELSWETIPFKYDRGRKFRLDAMDVDETNFVASATLVMNEFVRTQVIPELDLVRIAGMAEAGNEITTGADLLAKFRNAIVAVRDTGYEGNLVANVSFAALEELERLNGGLGTISYNDFDFPAIGDVRLVPTASNRMFDEVEKDEGVIKPTLEANALAFVLSAETAPLGIVKHTVDKIITPEANQLADAYDIHYRVYHTIDVLDNKKDLIAYAIA